MNGSAWDGDWKARLKRFLSKRGFSSVRAFSAASPTKSFLELAEDDVAAIQLQWTALDEAEEAGEMESLARDLLVRSVHSWLPKGWDNAVVMPRVHAISSWSASISSHLPLYKPLLRALSHTMIVCDPFPNGWLPKDSHDPILIVFFQGNWLL